MNLTDAETDTPHERYRFLIMLLITDAVFIILHLIYVYTPHLNRVVFSLTYPGSHSEFFQYIKELWIAVLFMVLALQHRKGMYALLSLLFLYLLFDDSFEFHENFGAVVAEFFNFQPAFGLRGVDFGELAVSAVFGGLFLIAIAITYRLSDEVTRRVTRITLVLLAALVFFGVFLDMVEVINPDPAGSRVLRVIEEGGELVVMSVITWFVFGLNEFIRRSIKSGVNPLASENHSA
jgi:hypothetical protein